MTLAIPPDVTIQSVVGQPGFDQCDETHQVIFCPSRAVYRPCEKLLMSRDVIIEQDGNQNFPSRLSALSRAHAAACSDVK